MPEHRDRQFAAKVQCFNAGYEIAKRVCHDVVGNIDADISFVDDYLEFLINKFIENPKLGVAGTPFIEDSGYSSILDSFEGGKHVAGGCQLFRKACFEDIGGYRHNKAGGIDWIAVTSARMRGWQTQSFPEKFFHHHRAIGTGGSGQLKSYFHYGKKDYYLGNSPLWEAMRIGYRLTKKPYLVGGIITFAGYLWALLTRMERPISKELMEFHRQEEIRKLKAIFKQVIRTGRIDKFELDF
jgi:hypothetical protein